MGFGVAMCPEPIKHDDVAWPQTRREAPGHVSSPGIPIHRSGKEQWREDSAIESQSEHQRDVLPIVHWRSADDALTSMRATIPTGHRQIQPELINEDVALHVSPMRSPHKGYSPGLDIRPLLLAGMEGLFLYVTRNRLSAR